MNKRLRLFTPSDFLSLTLRLVLFATRHVPAQLGSLSRFVQLCQFGLVGSGSKLLGSVFQRLPVLHFTWNSTHSSRTNKITPFEPNAMPVFQNKQNELVGKKDLSATHRAHVRYCANFTHFRCKVHFSLTKLQAFNGRATFGVVESKWRKSTEGSGRGK